MIRYGQDRQQNLNSEIQKKVVKYRGKKNSEMQKKIVKCKQKSEVRKQNGEDQFKGRKSFAFKK